MTALVIPEAKPVDPHAIAVASLNRFAGPARLMAEHGTVLNRSHWSLSVPRQVWLAEEWGRSDNARRHIDRLHGELAACPDERVLRSLAEVFRDAAASKVSPEVAQVILSTMLDGMRARTTEATLVYLDAISGLIDDPWDAPHSAGFPISAPTLAWAVRRVWRKHKFAPSPAELLEICRDIAREFSRCAEMAEALVRWRQEASDLVTFASSLPSPQPGSIA